MDYELIFLPKNSIPALAKIKIDFPVAKLVMVKGTSYDFVYIEEGLDDESDTSQVTCNLLNNY